MGAFPDLSLPGGYATPGIFSVPKTGSRDSRRSTSPSGLNLARFNIVLSGLVCHGFCMDIWPSFPNCAFRSRVAMVQVSHRIFVCILDMFNFRLLLNSPLLPFFQHCSGLNC